jgi:hypothetical protein
MPDPKDRSVNSPSYIANADQVLGYYNAHNKDEKKERVVDSVKKWYVDKAQKEGWKRPPFMAVIAFSRPLSNLSRVSS